MQSVSIFFLLLSIAFLIYIFYVFKTDRRIHMIIEFIFTLFYVGVVFILIYPQSLSWIESFFKVGSAIEFLLILAMLVSYLLLFILYKKDEDQRIEITKLVREIAILKGGKKNK